MLSRFESREDLCKHVSKTHTGIKDFFVCLHCPAQYFLEAAFAEHVKTAHEEKRDYRCSVCFVSFKAPVEMFIHMRANHTTPEAK